MEKFLKKSGWVSIIESLVFLLFGIILAFRPEGTVDLISKILGFVFIVIGISNVISYIKFKENYILMSGIIAIVIGFIALFYMGVILSVFRIIIGAWIIYTGIVRLTSSLQLKKINSNMGICSLILAIIILLCGIYTVLNNNAIIVTIGVIMIIYSIIDLIENIIFVKNLNKLY